MYQHLDEYTTAQLTLPTSSFPQELESNTRKEKVEAMGRVLIHWRSVRLLATPRPPSKKGSVVTVMIVPLERYNFLRRANRTASCDRNSNSQTGGVFPDGAFSWVLCRFPQCRTGALGD